MEGRDLGGESYLMKAPPPLQVSEARPFSWAEPSRLDADASKFLMASFYSRASSFGNPRRRRSGAEHTE